MTCQAELDGQSGDGGSQTHTLNAAGNGQLHGGSPIGDAGLVHDGG
jgi:hypothetical protein